MDATLIPMRIFFLWLLLIPLFGIAQKFEPEFKNSGVVISGLPSDTIATKLDRTTLHYSSGFGWGNPFSPKSHAIADGNTSSCVIPGAENYAILIRCNDNSEDPASFIQIIQFEKKKKERKIQVASYNLFLAKSDAGNKIKHVQFDAKKYGNSSFILYPDKLEPGEYGVLIYNPSNSDEKPAQALCFTIE